MDRYPFQYLDRWVLAYENHTAERVEPGTANGYYSLRKPRKFRRPDGSESTPNVGHAHVWSALVSSAHDLTKSVTHTWVGKETLMQKSSMNERTFTETLNDLIAIGLVRLNPRGPKRMSGLRLHLVPLTPGQKNYVIESVSIAPEDMGFYVCKAAVLRGQSEEPFR